nr:hypothetical protein [uncultured bacterium]
MFTLTKCIPICWIATNSFWANPNMLPPRPSRPGISEKMNSTKRCFNWFPTIIRIWFRYSSPAP